MMKLIAALLVLLGSMAPATAQDTVDVVTPHETIGSIVTAVGGEHVDVEVLSSGMRDPHYIAAKPSYMNKTRRADLWIRFGMDLEIGYERLILEGSRNGDIMVGGPGHLDLSEGIIPLEVPTGSVDRSMGDVHPQGNPHYWLDPYNGRVMARAIAGKLAELRPELMEEFIESGEAFVDRIDKAMFGPDAVEAVGGDALWQAELNDRVEKVLQEAGVSTAGWYETLRPHAGKAFVSYHRTFSYFADRFGLEVPIELEPKPGIPPGPRHVLQVIKTIKSNNISLIVLAPYANTSSAESAASRTDAEVLVVPTAVGGSEAATDYISFIDQLITLVAENL